MGGILAFEIWRQAPQRVTHMALLDTNPHAEKASRKSRRLEEIGQAAAGGLRELATEQLKPLYLAEAHRDDQELLDTLLDLAMDLGPEIFRSQSLALRDRVDSAPTLPTIDCPVLVACGEEDKLCPVEYHTFMAEKIPNATLAIIENCGHLSTLEQPEIVTGLLLEPTTTPGLTMISSQERILSTHVGSLPRSKNRYRHSIRPGERRNGCRGE